KKKKVMEEADLEETESLEKYIGERDDNEENDPEGDQGPLVFSVHDSEEEGREEEHEFLFVRHKGSQEEEGTQDMGRIEEVCAQNQKTPNLAEEKINEVVEREETKIIEALKEQ
ncbi:hypothetical protein KI387_024192, partial [Taxus chinensis]